MKTVLSVILSSGVLLCVVASGCDRTSVADESNTVAPSTTPVSTAQGGDWGTIKGKIIWGGKQIPAAVIKLDPANPGTPMCLKANKGEPPPDEFRITGKDKGLKDTFVWLVDPAKKPLPIHPDLKEIKVKQVVIDQPACHFIPHAIAVREGQTLLVKNSSSFQHNFKYTGNRDVPENSGNPLLPPDSEVKIMLKADRLPIQISCGIHPWMSGWIRVFNNPYHAVTSDDGSFEIKNAPVGDFRLMIWHASAGWKDGAKGRNGDPVTIRAGENNLGNIIFPEPPE